MTSCFVCGHDYDHAFTITTHDGQSHAFDSFECAIHALAPTCGHCGCRIVGHGVAVEARIYCCSHCARAQAGVELTDSL